MREKNRWHPCFLDRDYKRKLRQEMAAVTGRFEPGPACAWCRDSGMVRDRRTGAVSPCPHCPKGRERAEQDGPGAEAV